MARAPAIVLRTSLAAAMLGGTPLARAERLPHFLPVADCGIAAAEASRWRGNRRLDRAAASWARGATLHAALEQAGYTAGAASGLHVDGIHASQPPAAGATTCRILRNRALVETGVFERGNEAWLVFAAPVALPAPGEERSVARQALELVNRLRRSPQRCGSRTLPAADPLRLSDPLGAAAVRHARDMAQHHYFEHQDRSGHTPADRVRATGYSERRVGENIARGALSTEDAITGWLSSPGHCENLMDPEFTEMGIAYASEPGDRTDLYWVQVLAARK